MHPVPVLQNIIMVCVTRLYVIRYDGREDRSGRKMAECQMPPADLSPGPGTQQLQAPSVLSPPLPSQDRVRAENLLQVALRPPASHRPLLRLLLSSY